MALSPNYGWAEPDNSSLVKNGAQDIRALGDAIDTSVWNVGFGQAGKNKIINGDFSVNQRSFTSTTADGTYGFDRWLLSLSGASATYSAQTFTLGTAPVAGYEGRNFARLAVTTGNDFLRLNQAIESVRTFAGQTMTLSFWAKGTNPTTAGNLKATVVQNFGTGGSPSASVSEEKTFVLTANWTRYTLTYNVASIAGKTLGTAGNDSLQIWFGQGTNASADSWTLDLWGVQAEYGSKMTPFQTASGTLQGELALCQRYYYRMSPAAVTSGFGSGLIDTTSTSLVKVSFKNSMRVAPTALEQSGTATDYQVRYAGSSIACSSVPAFSSATADEAITLFTTAATLTAGQSIFGRAGATAAYLGWSAEL